MAERAAWGGVGGAIDVINRAVQHVAGACPVFDFVPTEEAVRLLDGERVFEMMMEVTGLLAEEPAVLALSGRLLILASRPTRGQSASAGSARDASLSFTVKGFSAAQA